MLLGARTLLGTPGLFTRNTRTLRTEQRASLLGARTLLGARGLGTRNKRTLLVAKGIAARSKDAQGLLALLLGTRGCY